MKVRVLLRTERYSRQHPWDGRYSRQVQRTIAEFELEDLEAVGGIGLLAEGQYEVFWMMPGPRPARTPDIVLGEN